MPDLDAHPLARPDNATPIRQIDGYKDRISISAALVATTSTSLATILGSAILDTDAGVTIISDGTVQYNPAGTAVGTSGFLPTVYTIHGGKDFLDTVRLYAAATPTVSVLVFEVYSA